MNSAHRLPFNGMISTTKKMIETSAYAVSKYRPEIDGLRAFAVVAVIINHFNKDILPSGYLGVDIFFVISGFVITSSLSGRKSSNLRDFIISFYERRIKRLIPALVVFLLITSFLICLFTAKPGIPLVTAISSLYGFSNIYLFSQSTDYFAQSTQLNPFTHTWSLGVEEQFYFIFPFLVWFSGYGKQALNGSRNLFYILGSLSIASLIGFIFLYQTNQSAAYFLMPARFWEMAAGSLVFLVFHRKGWIGERLELAPPILVLTAMGGVMFLPLASAVPATIAITLLTGLLICCLKKGTSAFRLFTNQKIVYVGLISYSLYLWHWGVLTISRLTIGIRWWTLPFQIILILMMAIGSFRWVEMPFRGRR